MDFHPIVKENRVLSEHSEARQLTTLVMHGTLTVGFELLTATYHRKMTTYLIVT